RVQLTVAEQVQRIGKESTRDAARRDEEALGTLKSREFNRADVTPSDMVALKSAAAFGWKEILALTVGDVLNAALSVVQERRPARPATGPAAAEIEPTDLLRHRPQRGSRNGCTPSFRR